MAYTTFPADRVSGLAETINEITDSISGIDEKIEASKFTNPFKDKYHWGVYENWPVGSVCRLLWASKLSEVARRCEIFEHRLLVHSGHVVGIKWEDNGQAEWWTAAKVHAVLATPEVMEL